MWIKYAGYIEAMARWKAKQRRLTSASVEWASLRGIASRDVEVACVRACQQ